MNGFNYNLLSNLCNDEFMRYLLTEMHLATFFSFNDEGKNQGYNENHLCNISNFFTNSSSGRAKKIITN